MAGRTIMAPEISVTRAEVTENNAASGGSYIAFQVTLSEASSDEVSVGFRSIAGTATEADFWDGWGTDTLTIAAGETTGWIHLKTYGDSLDEVDESVWLELFN